MTEKEADMISSFIDNLSEEDSNSLFEEVLGTVSVYFGTVVFSELIENTYNLLSEKGLSQEEIAKEIKSKAPGNDEICAKLVSSLENDDKAWEFAQDCVQSISYNVTYPEIVEEKLEAESIDLEDFGINLIFAFKDTIVDLFVNELDLDEWKKDIVELLVASWE